MRGAEPSLSIVRPLVTFSPTRKRARFSRPSALVDPVSATEARRSSLPLSYFLPPAREQDGQGARIAKLTSLPSLIFGSTFGLAVVTTALRRSAAAPILVAIFIVALSALFYARELGGVTGDCFGATSQLTEIAVYFCGVWAI